MRTLRAFGAALVFAVGGALVAFGAEAQAQADSGSIFLPAESAAIVRARAAALLMSGQEGGNLSLGVIAVPFSEGDLRSSVVVLAEIPGYELLRNTEGSKLPVEVFFYGLSGGQEVRAQSNLAIRLDLDRHRALLEATGLKVVTTLRLLPGEHLIRILVRTAAGGFGARSYPLTVPNPGAPRTSAILVEENESWLVVTDPVGREGSEGAYPLAWGGHRRLPAAVAELRGDGPWDAWVIVGGLADTPALTARFRDMDGIGSASSSVEVAERFSLLDDRALRLRIAHPGLGPGRYELKLAAHAPGSEDLESPGLPLLIESTGLGDGAPSKIAAGALDSPSPKKNRSRKKAMELPPYLEGYRRVLASVKEGEQATVEQSLDELILQAWEELGEGAPAALGESLAAVLEEEDRWLAVLPMIQAHLDLANRALGEWKYALAQFAARTALDLALARATVFGTEAAAQEAAAVATCLAEAYLGTGSRALAASLLDRALELDEDQEAALLLLAALQEKEGRYSESAGTLRRLVGTHPDHGEGELRLAIQEVRLRQPGKARRRFESLLESQAPSWVQLLAVQELARLHRETGREGLAEEVLQRATERWPDNARIKIMRAQLLDDSRSFVLARFLLAQGDEAPQVSERERYNRWPVEPIRRLRVDLRAAARDVLSTAHPAASAPVGAGR